ncbi:hypothetical protein CCACVL1_08285 [Corchorus capsularis]|uniref:Uncharacterized protein n=1 Tax=Corchorus capsularis TaxID=210143 RepID=A0A1R3J1I5_COCAP|nr:hypothetical protein CCACVL1_08285 [Corchorus capsularis]
MTNDDKTLQQIPDKRSPLLADPRQIKLVANKPPIVSRPTVELPTDPRQTKLVASRSPIVSRPTMELSAENLSTKDHTCGSLCSQTVNLPRV